MDWVSSSLEPVAILAGQVLLYRWRRDTGLDLRGLINVEVVEDGKMVQAGPDALWDAVCRKLDPLGCSVADGRVAGVGVGELTLGGGISHLSPSFRSKADRHPSYCDNLLIITKYYSRHSLTPSRYWRLFVLRARICIVISPYTRLDYYCSCTFANSILNKKWISTSQTQNQSAWSSQKSRMPYCP